MVLPTLHATFDGSLFFVLAGFFFQKMMAVGDIISGCDPTKQTKRRSKGSICAQRF